MREQTLNVVELKGETIYDVRKIAVRGVCPSHPGLDPRGLREASPARAGAGAGPDRRCRYRTSGARRFTAAVCLARSGTAADLAHAGSADAGSADADSAGPASGEGDR